MQRVNYIYCMHTIQKMDRFGGKIITHLKCYPGTMVISVQLLALEQRFVTLG